MRLVLVSALGLASALFAAAPASAKTVVGCWGIDRAGKRFVETSVKDLGEIDYNGLMLVLNGWKKHANSLGYDYAECNVYKTRDETVLSLERRRNWNLDHSQSRSAWMDESQAPPPPAEPSKVYVTGSSSSPTDEPTSADRKRKIARTISDAPAPSKYVEVAGPNGTIRLSPEVAARNQAAADEYRRKMEEHARAKAEHDQRLAAHAQNTADAAAAKREHERQLAINAAQVAASQAAQEDYKKVLAKPAGVNAVYRGFSGPTCEIARNSAVRGSGTDKGSQFKEVTYVLSDKPRQCIVQGWAWTTSKTGSSRQ